MDEEQWAAYQASLADDEEPGDPDLDEDPDNSPPPGLDDARLAELIGEAREVTAEEARAAARAARLGAAGALAAVGSAAGRRGPQMPGSAHRFPGECAGPAAGFGTGRELDTAPGCAVLALFAEDAAGDDDRYAGATDDELLGAISAWDRIEASASARKHGAVAELMRRRSEPGCGLEGPAAMPAGCDEFVPAELAPALGVSRRAAEDLLALAWALEVMLPGTKAALRAGILSRYKAGIVAWATQLLDPDEAQAAEALVLGRAGALTPGGLRVAIARAVMQVAPEKAAKRREAEARRARVERWAEASGNAALAGRELPPAQVLAADQRVTAWAELLKKAGLEGSMDQLRARAYLDILLGMDSRPGQAAGSQDNAARSATGGQDGGGTRWDDPDRGGSGSVGPDGPAGSGSGSVGPDGPAGSGSGSVGPDGPETSAFGGPVTGAVPPGFAGRVTLTIPLATLLELADRPGEIPGIGPIDPALARDLAYAAARNPRSTWCVTVTDQDGHAIGHGCARPEPNNHRTDTAKHQKLGALGAPGGPSRPGTAGRVTGTGGTGNRDGPPVSGPPPERGSPGFGFTGDDAPGPPGGYGTWRLSTGTPGRRDLLVAIEPVSIKECDHRHQAKGHDPGVVLRHLTQVRHATCTGPACRRPAIRCDFEHNIPYGAGGRTCLCNGDPKCRYDHRLKQDPRWTVEQLPGGYVRWTTPAGRQYVTEPTRYSI